MAASDLRGARRSGLETRPRRRRRARSVPTRIRAKLAPRRSGATNFASRRLGTAQRADASRFSTPLRKPRSKRSWRTRRRAQASSVFSCCARSRCRTRRRIWPSPAGAPRLDRDVRTATAPRRRRRDARSRRRDFRRPRRACRDCDDPAAAVPEQVGTRARSSPRTTARNRRAARLETARFSSTKRPSAPTCAVRHVPEQVVVEALVVALGLGRARRRRRAARLVRAVVVVVSHGRALGLRVVAVGVAGLGLLLAVVATARQRPSRLLADDALVLGLDVAVVVRVAGFGFGPVLLGLGGPVHLGHGCGGGERLLCSLQRNVVGCVSGSFGAVLGARRTRGLRLARVSRRPSRTAVVFFRVSTGARVTQ